MRRRIFYFGASSFCVLHAVGLSYSIFALFSRPTWMSPTDYDSAIRAWYVLIAIWPLWSAVLWYAGGRRWARLLIPFSLGVVALLPALFVLWIALAMAHSSC